MDDSSESFQEINGGEESMGDEIVSLKRLSEMLGIDRSHARKWILAQGVTSVKRRTSDSGGQLVISFTREESEKLLAIRKSQGFLGANKTEGISDEYGVFYVIELVPELCPNRVKLGFANNVAERLGQHRTASPTAQVKKTWPCRRSWERTVMDALTAQGCLLLLNEVFECENLDALIKRGDVLFALLPSPRFVIPLAEHSPLRNPQ